MVFPSRTRRPEDHALDMGVSRDWKKGDQELKSRALRGLASHSSRAASCRRSVLSAGRGAGRRRFRTGRLRTPRISASAQRVWSLTRAWLGRSVPRRGGPRTGAAGPRLVIPTIPMHFYLLKTQSNRYYLFSNSSRPWIELNIDEFFKSQLINTIVTSIISYSLKLLDLVSYKILASYYLAPLFHF